MKKTLLLSLVLLLSACDGTPSMQLNKYDSGTLMLNIFTSCLEGAVPDPSLADRDRVSSAVYSCKRLAYDGAYTAAWRLHRAKIDGGEFSED